jgi:hypothetical protein
VHLDTGSGLPFCLPIHRATPHLGHCSGIFLLLGLAGLYWRIEGVYTYSWGNVFRIVPSGLDPLGLAFWFVFCLSACWLLFQARKRATSPLERRHLLYVLSGLLVLTFAIVKVGVVMGIDIPILLPLGMFLVDGFNAIMGLAIIKDKLFDITVIIEKGTVYSLLAGLLIFVYSLSEHVFISFVGETFGEQSNLAQFVSIAVGIAVLIPVKNRLERATERYFAPRKLTF